MREIIRLLAVKYRKITMASLFALWLVVAGFGSMLDYWTSVIVQVPFIVILIALWGTAAFTGYYNRILEKNYLSVPLEDWLAAGHYAHVKMSNEGYAYPADYIRQAKDCVEYTRAMMFFMQEWFYDQYDDEEIEDWNIPMAPFSFRTRNNQRHMLVECLVDEKHSVYPDVWPGEELVYEMTKGEESTSLHQNFRNSKRG